MGDHDKNVIYWFGDMPEAKDIEFEPVFNWEHLGAPIGTLSSEDSNGNFFFKLRAHFMPEIKNVIFNEPATIVFWSDGTKTVVKCENENFDPEKGLAMAISKKALGNKGNYFNEFKKWIEPYEEENNEFLKALVTALFKTKEEEK